MREAGETTILSAEVGFCEGPVILADGSTAAVAIDRGQITRTTAEGETSVLAKPGSGPNGLVAASEGFYLAQNGGIWPASEKGVAGVQHVDSDGTVRQIAEGMVAPNDLAFGPDGLLYVTDPTRSPARNDGRIWRVDPTTGRAEVWLRVDWYPNGIAFGLDPDWVHVADTGGGRIVRIPRQDKDLARMETVFALRHGLPDGFAFDVEGRIVSASIGATEQDPGCVEILDPADGSVRRIDCAGSRFVTNVAIGPDGRMVIADSGSGRLLTFAHDAPGLPLHPFRRDPQ